MVGENSILYRGQDWGVDSFGRIYDQCYSKLRQNKRKKLHLPEDLDPGDYPNHPTF